MSKILFPSVKDITGKSELLRPQADLIFAIDNLMRQVIYIGSLSYLPALRQILSSCSFHICNDVDSICYLMRKQGLVSQIETLFVVEDEAGHFIDVDKIQKILSLAKVRLMLITQAIEISSKVAQNRRCIVLSPGMLISQYKMLRKWFIEVHSEARQHERSWTNGLALLLTSPYGAQQLPTAVQVKFRDISKLGAQVRLVGQLGIQMKEFIRLQYQTKKGQVVTIESQILWQKDNGETCDLGLRFLAFSS